MPSSSQTTRAGRYVSQPTGYQAFLPNDLPPQPSVKISPEMQKLLSDADRALGRLDGVASVLPNPDLFVAMYVRQEAVLSSQIEGTQSTLEDILEFEADQKSSKQPEDVEEVYNYVRAMNYGLNRLQEFPLSLRLIKEIHGELLRGVRGSERNPGEFRTSQNWIGPAGATSNTASFVPPPPHEMQQSLANLELFLHDRESLPVLVHCAIAHAQFETIHPFLDGNGRVGRLLITLLLCERSILRLPLLYLSYYLKANRTEYYDRLMAIRLQGDWEGWIQFFLRGVLEVSQGSTETARAILDLRDRHRQIISEKLTSKALGLKLLDHLYEKPLTSIKQTEKFLECAYMTAAGIVEEFEVCGILREVTGQQRNRRFRYQPYLDLFDRPVFPRVRS